MRHPPISDASQKRLEPRRFCEASLTVLAFLLIVPAAPACNVPVFRFALEKWKPDLYRVYVFHQGPLAKEHAALVKTLGKYGPGEDVPSNLELNVLDLDKDDAE